MTSKFLNFLKQKKGFTYQIIYFIYQTTHFSYHTSIQASYLHHKITSGVKKYCYHKWFIELLF